MLLVPSVEPGRRPEGRCKSHMKFFKSTNVSREYSSEAPWPGWQLAVTHLCAAVADGVLSCIFLSFLALPRTGCPWAGGRAVEAHVLLSRKRLPVSLSFVKIWNMEGLLNASEHQGCECRALCLVNLSRHICWATSEKSGRETGNP